jgi:hypothetical protein
MVELFILACVVLGFLAGVRIADYMLAGTTAEIRKLTRELEFIDIAGRQRMQMIDYMYRAENSHRVREMLDAFADVSFEEHVNCLADGNSLSSLYSRMFLPVINEIENLNDVGPVRT